MNTALWILQVLSAAVFLAHGLLYLLPPAAMRKTMEGMPFSTGFFRFIGVVEILCAFGLILPGWTGILPWLTPLERRSSSG